MISHRFCGTFLRIYKNCKKVPVVRKYLFPTGQPFLLGTCPQALFKGTNKFPNICLLHAVMNHVGVFLFLSLQPVGTAQTEQSPTKKPERERECALNVPCQECYAILLVKQQLKAVKRSVDHLHIQGKDPSVGPDTAAFAA